MKAIEDGLYTRTTKERLEALEIQKDELTAKIADEKLKKPSFNEDFIRFWRGLAPTSSDLSSSAES